jgi:hypothetical protein
MVNAFFCAEICIHHAQRPSMVENLRKAEFDAMDMGLKCDNPWGHLGRLVVCNPDYIIYLTCLLVPDWLGSVKLCLP